MSAEEEPDLEPILQSELKMLEVQLKNGATEEKINAFDCLCELGRRGRQLVPVVHSMMGQNLPWLTPSRLIRFLDASEDESILQGLRRANLLDGLGIWDQVVCFRHGAEELEDDLRSYIWQHRHTPGNPARPEVVKALGEKGGHEALSMMRALLVELGEYNELQPENILKVFETGAQVRLREEVSKAITLLGKRGIR